MTSSTPSQSNDSYDLIKLGIDSLARYRWVNRDGEGATPQPIQKMPLNQ